MEILLQIMKHFSTTAFDNYGRVLSSVSPRCRENLLQLTGDIKRLKTGYSSFLNQRKVGTGKSWNWGGVE